MGFSVERLLLTSDEKAELKRRVRAHSSSHRDVLRAKAILLVTKEYHFARLVLKSI